LNQRLEVALGVRGTAQYFSRLVEETGDRLRISLPEMEGDLMSVREGDPLRLWYTQSGGYWCLNTVVHSVAKRAGETLIEIDRHGDVHRAQRRNHVRVDVALMLHAAVDQRESSDEQLTPLGQRVSAVTRDISGGGVSFRTGAKLSDKDRLSLTFYLPEHGGDINSKARVVHVRPDADKPDQFLVACTFERMAITDRERIIRFLFFRQRELANRKKVGSW
jgi:c-di-GMP-binding flagellar brake protein YcgR